MPVTTGTPQNKFFSRGAQWHTDSKLQMPFLATHSAVVRCSGSSLSWNMPTFQNRAPSECCEDGPCSSLKSKSTSRAWTFQADKSNPDSHHQHGQQLQVCTVYIPQPRSPYPSPLPTSKSIEKAVKTSRPWSCQTQQSMKHSKLLVSKVQSGLADTYHSTCDHLDKPINGRPQYLWPFG